LPVEGYQSITVPDFVYKKLQKLASSTHRSIPKLIEYLLEGFDNNPISIQEQELEVPTSG